MMTRFSALAIIFAASFSAPLSPCGGADSVSFGMESSASPSTGCSCSMPSAMITTGSIGGVVANL